MTITLEIPEALAAKLGGGSPQEVSRQALEALVLAAYRKDRIAGPQAAEVLGFSRMRWEHFLEDHHVLENAYTVEDLERDVTTLRWLRAEGALLRKLPRRRIGLLEPSPESDRAMLASMSIDLEPGGAGAVR